MANAFLFPEVTFVRFFAVQHIHMSKRVYIYQQKWPPSNSFPKGEKKTFSCTEKLPLDHIRILLRMVPLLRCFVDTYYSKRGTISSDVRDRGEPRSYMGRPNPAQDGCFGLDFDWLNSDKVSMAFFIAVAGAALAAFFPNFFATIFMGKRRRRRREAATEEEEEGQQQQQLLSLGSAFICFTCCFPNH